MIRDFLLAPERTTTQSRETDLTHRRVCRDVGAALATDFVGCGLASTAGAGTGAGGVKSGDAVGVGSTGTGSGGTVSRGTLSTFATVDCCTTLSTETRAARGATASTLGGGVAATFVADVFRARVGSPGTWRSHAVPTMATAPATATPLRTCGQMGGRAGFVPHHRHDPTVSG
jgi:hypothetical protein